MSPLPTPGEFLGARPPAINNNGMIVGAVHSYLGGPAVVWPDAETVIILPGFAEEPIGEALDVNDDGLIVGWSNTPQGDQRAAIWWDGQIHDLNTLMQTDSRLTLTTAHAVNNGGEILASGIQDGVISSVLLTPVFEPQPVVGDLDGDGAVGFSDLLLLLAGWGPCQVESSCPADIDTSGAVGFADLLTLLTNWTD